MVVMTRSILVTTSVMFGTMMLMLIALGLTLLRKVG